MTSSNTIAHFDPRTVPVLSVDTQSKPVATSQLGSAALRERFAKPPVWQPEVRDEPPFIDRPPVPAAVLVAVVAHAQPTVLLTERAGQLSTHSGQIAFAGGKLDAQDADATAAALREAWEEVGLSASHCEVIGQLPTFVTGTAFEVTPVVALVQPGFALNINADEVADAFEVPLHFLMNPANHRQHQLHWQGRVRHWWSMPYDDAGRERYIWGITAGMLRNLYRFLSA